jgi:hypothetical protein
MYNNVDIVCITETHLHDEILESEIQIDGFRIFRQDRNLKLDGSVRETSGGGGSIIYVRDNIIASRVLAFNRAPDSVAVKIDTSDGQVCVACIYRSPALNYQQNELLRNCIMGICDEKNDYETILLGDFNLPNVSWDTGVLNAKVSSTNKALGIQGKFIELFNDKGMTWYFKTESTRRRLVNGVLQESLLDQILYTNDALVNSCKILSPLGKSDHVCIKVELGVNSNVCNTSKKKYGFKTTWGKITGDELLSCSKQLIDWNYTSTECVQNMWDELHGKLMSISATVPKSPVYTDNRPVDLPWNTSALKRKRKNKDRAWHTFDTTPTESNLSYALEKQSLFETEDVKAKVKYEKRITHDLKRNCKSFYSYLRNKRRIKTSIPALDKGDGTRSNNPADAADVLASAFSSVFVSEPYGPLPRCNVKSKDYSITDIIIEPANVAHELLKLDIFKSIGPDGVHPKLLKALAVDKQFVGAVTELFRKCSDTGKLPSVWKSATVVALFKKGSKSDPLNYRPVSLTCILCKVYEKLIRSHIVNYIEDSISTQQHGFVRGKSCLSNLLETVDTILDILDSGAPVDLLYFDFSKAFDTVPHFRLLSKLESLGITGKVLEVIRDFISNRTMRVSVNGECSKIKQVLSGVPQGSVLGPLLFVLFINDLPDNIKNKVKLFADDLKLVGNASNYSSIADDLAELENWEERWLLKFNLTKCKVLHVNMNNNPENVYMLDGKQLESSDQEKDLGVTTHSSLLWNEQMKHCINKANRMICWIVRNVVLREKTVMLSIYKALVRPHLEYCVQLWNPVRSYGSWATILEIEGVQRRFTRLIDEIGMLPYSRRLEILNLTTLAERRERGDLIETFKAVNNISGYDSSMFKVSRSGSNLVSRPRSNRGSTKLQNLQRSFLTERVIVAWNKLPVYVKNADSVLVFKIRLEQYKKDNLSEASGNFWEASNEVLARIETLNYFDNKDQHNVYLWFNPFVARKRFININ